MPDFDGERSSRRADAQRNIAGILDAAITLLGRKPDASMDDIAETAGVTRQTVYAHFRSRQALLDAAVERITADVATALGAVDVEAGTAVSALRRWADAAWSLLERYPMLLSSAMPAVAQHEEIDRHAPVIGGLSVIIHRGQCSNEFDPSMPLGWLVAAAVALGHAAGSELAAGRMTARRAGDTFVESLLRVCGAAPVDTGSKERIDRRQRR